MKKEKFLQFLKTFRVEESEKMNCYNLVIKEGLTKTFKYFTDEEAYMASNYLIRYPHIYYNNYLRFMYGVSECKPIEKPTDEIREIIWEYCRTYQRRFVGNFFYFNDHIKIVRIPLTDGDIKRRLVESPLSRSGVLRFLGYENEIDAPMGKVIYDNGFNTYFVYIDKECVPNKAIKIEVLKQFNLCKHNTIFCYAKRSDI